MRNDRYSIIEKREFYETFVYELNNNLQKMGLGWKVVLPDHISDGCVIRERLRNISFCSI